MGVQDMSLPEESQPLAPESASDDAGIALDVLDSAGAGGLMIRGGILRVLGYAGGVVLSVVSAAVVTRHLGVSRFGQYTTVTSLVAVVAAVTDSGMSNVGTREYAVLHEPERSRMMSNLLGLRVVLTLLGVLLVMIFALAVGYSEALAFGALAGSLATVALVWQHTLSIPLATDLRLGTLSVLELGRQILLVVGLVLLAMLGAGVFPLLGVPLIANLALIAPTALLVRGRVSAHISLRPSAWPPLLSATVVFSLATAVGVIYVYTAQVLTSLVASHYQSGLFAVSFRVFVVSASLPGLVVAGTLPLLSRAARDDHDRLVYVLQRIFEAASVAGVGSAVVLSAGSGFVVSVIAGPAYASAAPVLAIQSFAMVGSFVVAGWSFGLLSMRLHRGLLVSNLAALIVSVVLTLLLSRYDGARGAAVATVCGEVTLAAGSLLALVWRRPRYRPQLTVVAKVGAAGAAAAALSLTPGMPSVVRPVVAFVVYGAVILGTRALPAELRELLPSHRPQR
jgi:O-antigen/teichoic acid export membrane protein